MHRKVGRKWDCFTWDGIEKVKRERPARSCIKSVCVRFLPHAVIQCSMGGCIELLAVIGLVQYASRKYSCGDVRDESDSLFVAEARGD